MKEINSPEQKEISEIILPDNRFQDIKPKEDISKEECDQYWDDVFDEKKRQEKLEEELEHLIGEYFEELLNYSDYPETIVEAIFEMSDIEMISVEDNKIQKKEFESTKRDLKSEWEHRNGIPWPRYDEDVYSDSGNLIRKKGDCYDAHHILPSKMGGKNVVENITPLHASVHYDRQGIHRDDGPYGQMSKIERKIV